MCTEVGTQNTTNVKEIYKYQTSIHFLSIM